MTVTLIEDYTVGSYKNKVILTKGTSLVVKHKGTKNYSCQLPDKSATVKIPKSILRINDTEIPTANKTLTGNTRKDYVFSEITRLINDIMNDFSYSIDSESTRDNFKKSVKSTILNYFDYDESLVIFDHISKTIIVNQEVINSFKSDSEDPFTFTYILPYLDERIVGIEYNVNVGNKFKSKYLYTLIYEEVTDPGVFGYRTKLLNMDYEFYDYLKSEFDKEGE